MGSIRAREDSGKLFIDFRYKGKRCREQTLLDDTLANRKKLELLLSRIESFITSGTFNYSETFPNSPKADQFPSARQLEQGPIFATFVDEWWSENAFRWKTSGKVNMKSILDKHLLPEFADMPVSKIEKGSLLKFRARLSELPGRRGELLSNKRINNIMQPLKAILDEAADRFNFASPFKNVKPLPLKKSLVEPFTLAEVIEIIRNADPGYRDYLTVRFFTGMRTGEINGLRWENVNYAARYIHVCEAYTYNEMTTPKTNESRDIQMNTLVMDALKHQETITRAYSDFVFCNRKGEPLDNSNFTTRIWYPLLEELGLKARRPYQTRHTAATLWLAAGENPEWVAHQLGHSSTQMLFQTYSRYIPNVTRQDGAAFEKLISNTAQSNFNNNGEDHE